MKLHLPLTLGGCLFLPFPVPLALCLSYPPSAFLLFIFQGATGVRLVLRRPQPGSRLRSQAALQAHLGAEQRAHYHSPLDRDAIEQLEALVKPVSLLEMELETLTPASSSGTDTSTSSGAGGNGSTGNTPEGSAEMNNPLPVYMISPYWSYYSPLFNPMLQANPLHSEQQQQQQFASFSFFPPHSIFGAPSPFGLDQASDQQPDGPLTDTPPQAAHVLLGTFIQQGSSSSTASRGPPVFTFVPNHAYHACESCVFAQTGSTTHPVGLLYLSPQQQQSKTKLQENSS